MGNIVLCNLRLEALLKYLISVDAVGKHNLVEMYALLEMLYLWLLKETQKTQNRETWEYRKSSKKTTSPRLYGRAEHWSWKQIMKRDVCGGGGRNITNVPPALYVSLLRKDIPWAYSRTNMKKKWQTKQKGHRELMRERNDIIKQIY